MHCADKVGIGCRKYVKHLKVDAVESEKVIKNTLAIYYRSRP